MQGLQQWKRSLERSHANTKPHRASQGRRHCRQDWPARMNGKEANEGNLAAVARLRFLHPYVHSLGHCERGWLKVESALWPKFDSTNET